MVADPGLSFISHMSQGDTDSPFRKPEARRCLRHRRLLVTDESQAHMHSGHCGPPATTTTSSHHVFHLTFSWLLYFWDTTGLLKGKELALSCFSTSFRQLATIGTECRWQFQLYIKTELSGSEVVQASP